MSPVAHMQYGWWFAHWGDFNRRERAVIALAGAGPDLDGLSFLAGSEPFHRYHHILFHNLGSTLAVAALAGIFLRRRPLAWLLTVFAFAMHMVEDYVTVAWNQYPWRPFAASAVNLSDRLPGWMVQGVFQAAAMLFILGTTVWIYLRHGRTPLEIVSPALDRLLINYAVLPWRNVCAASASAKALAGSRAAPRAGAGRCFRRAHFRCDRCGKTVCGAHGKTGPGLRVRCADCAG